MCVRICVWMLPHAKCIRIRAVPLKVASREREREKGNRLQVQNCQKIYFMSLFLSRPLKNPKIAGFIKKSSTSFKYFRTNHSKEREGALWKGGVILLSIGQIVPRIEWTRNSRSIHYISPTLVTWREWPLRGFGLRLGAQYQKNAFSTVVSHMA